MPVQRRPCIDGDCDGTLSLEVPEAHEWFCPGCDRAWVMLEGGKFVGPYEA